MDSARPHERPTAFDRMLAPLHRWIWSDADRRVEKLFHFGETETDGGRDILRAAEVTSDPLLRRLYVEHAIDEFRHGVLFRHRAAELLKTSHSNPGFQGDWLAPGGHGLDDLQVDSESDSDMLAFLHLSEKAADPRFPFPRELVIVPEIRPEAEARGNFCVACDKLVPGSGRGRSRTDLEGRGQSGSSRTLIVSLPNLSQAPRYAI